MRHVNIPIFIPELACPFQCIFCNQQKITGHHHLPKEEEIIHTIESHLATIELESTQVELAFFGGSFTGLSLDEQERLLRIPQSYIKEKSIQGIRISTRPDYISEEILEMLKRMNVSAIELGAQSLDEEVLLKAGRGHDVIDVRNASQLIIRYGFELGLQMMIGLPGDTKEKALTTAQKIVQMGAQTTRIYPTLVIKDTALEKLFYTDQYSPLSLEEAVDIVSAIIPIFEEANVKLLKVGLHPSEGLLSGEDFVAGPFHTNFKEMVMSAIWYEKINRLLPFSGESKVAIYIPKRFYNYAIGYRAENKLKWNKFYDSVIFISDDTLSNYPKIEIQ